LIWNSIVKRNEGKFPPEAKEKFFKICKSMDTKHNNKLQQADAAKALSLSGVFSGKTGKTGKTDEDFKSSERSLNNYVANNFLSRYLLNEKQRIDYNDLASTLEHSFVLMFIKKDYAILKITRNIQIFWYKKINCFKNREKTRSSLGG
jgi:hypothetical protein